MSEINVTSLLADMRALSVEAGGGRAPEVRGGSNFAKLLNSSIDDVNANQKQAAALAEAFEKGADVDLVEVMIALQKASLSFKAMTEVRNKLVTAYQEIMNMPV